MIEFRRCAIDDEPAASLVAAMRAELAEVYEGLDIDSPSMPKAGPAEFGGPAGVFIVGDEQGKPVCCGGVKPLGEGACELKRMFVVPDARGRGVARELLTELERRAREAGCHTARLDTGPRQEGARRLYEGAGYRPIHNFNGNPMASFFGEKRL